MRMPVMLITKVYWVANKIGWEGWEIESLGEGHEASSDSDGGQDWESVSGAESDSEKKPVETTKVALWLNVLVIY
jgi:hypothetical protein